MREYQKRKKVRKGYTESKREEKTKKTEEGRGG